MFFEWACSPSLFLDVCFSEEPAAYVTSILANLNKELEDGAGKKRLGINDFIKTLTMKMIF